MRENLCSLVVKLMTRTCKITPGSKYHITGSLEQFLAQLLLAEKTKHAEI